MEASSGESVANIAMVNAGQSFAEMTNTLRNRSATSHTRLPPPSSERLAASLDEKPHCLDEYVEQAQSKKQSVLYLAYGSNLCNETFRGKRGVKPLGQINVQVPSLQVTFDLPGIPYLEPCFANSGRRVPEAGSDRLIEFESLDGGHGNFSGNRRTKGGYRKDEWRKGLIGVVYEVTPDDYAHIIATEGGGASYQDILVDCYPFASVDPSEPIPETPTSTSFKAHTLFAPALPPDEPPPKDGGRVKRPDSSYAQASARYLKLMKDGAAELGLPYEYQEHLQSLRSYKITTIRQRIGQVAFLALWAPIVAVVFAMGKVFADERGRFPGWLKQLNSAVFAMVWKSYDAVFKPVFGDGERSLTDGEDGGGEVGGRSIGERRVGGRGAVGEIAISELEKSALSADLV